MVLGFLPFLLNLIYGEVEDGLVFGHLFTDFIGLCEIVDGDSIDEVEGLLVEGLIAVNS